MLGVGRGQGPAPPHSRLRVSPQQLPDGCKALGSASGFPPAGLTSGAFTPIGMLKFLKKVRTLSPRARRAHRGPLQVCGRARQPRKDAGLQGENDLRGGHHR